MVKATLADGVVNGSDPDLRRDLERDGCVLPSGLIVQVDRDTSLLQGVEGVDPKSMTATFVVVTRDKTRNRNGNKVQITAGPDGKGLLTDYYSQSPVVLFNHGFGDPLPVGLCQTSTGKFGLKVSAKQAVGTCRFHQHTEFAMVCFAMVSDRILNMASIGYNAILAKRLSEKERNHPDAKEGVEDWDRYHGGWDFVESELMEWSIVPIGADRGALRQSLDRRSIHGEKIREGTRQVLLPFAAERQAWCPGMPVELLQAKSSAEPESSSPLILRGEGITIEFASASVLATVVSEAMKLSADDPAPSRETQAASHDEDDSSDSTPGEVQSASGEDDALSVVAVKQIVEASLQPLRDQIARVAEDSQLTVEAARMAIAPTF